MAGSKKAPAGGGIGNALIGALEEAVAFERGDLPGVRVERVEITARDAEVEPPPAYTPERIRSIRKAMSLSQQVFAGLLASSASAVRAWEQGQRQPDGPTRRLLHVAETHPEALSDTLYGKKMAEYRARGWPRIAAERPLVEYGKKDEGDADEKKPR